MIFVGNDIIEIDRINSFIKDNNDRGLHHIFTNSEIEYCNSRANPSIHFAGRFAAKEAVKKAMLSAYPELVLPLNYISIDNKNNGAPFVKFNQSIKSSYPCPVVSISHSQTHATAVAILEIR
ncbi:MAG: holo-ACP synthase [Fidelibacterota bacterium]